MPFRFYERPNSRQSTSVPPTLTQNWVATGEHSNSIVKAIALSATPYTVAVQEGLLYRQDISLEPAGYDTYYVTVPYAHMPRGVGTYRIKFDTTGGTVHIRYSKETKGKYAATGSAPDFKGAIGVNGPDVEGADIIIPALKLSVSVRHPLAIITMAQIKNLARWTGQTNSDTFLTFAPGEVLFMGCTGSEGIECETEVEYQFACSENLANEVVNGITVVQKNGWDLSWVAFAPGVDATTNLPVKTPKYIYVERVYNAIPLATALGFGG